MAILQCKMCSGNLEYISDQDIYECPYCGTKQTVPSPAVMDNEKIVKMLVRANDFRKQCEFDQASDVFEGILAECPNDPEIFWSMVLCRYGVEYVKDPKNGAMIPTCHRTQFNSILNDPDYLSAIRFSNLVRKTAYEQEAAYIDKVQKGILEIANKEKPFDVFICYKETDELNNRTPDSVLAQDIYYQLVQEGFKVFFSRITLENHLGVEYEPYIFSALNSAKVMLVVGTKPEYFKATWVKNEWARYLRIIQNDKNKLIIPCYRDMNPYYLPEELSRYQSQDMSKIGFIQDLIRGIKKVMAADKKGETIVIDASKANSAEPLLIRAFQFLEFEEWENAGEYIEKVLDINPENAKAYLAKLMLELRVPVKERLKDERTPFDDKKYYKIAIRYADKDLREELDSYNEIIRQRIIDEKNQKIKEEAEALLKTKEKGSVMKAQQLLESLGDWKDAPAVLAICVSTLAAIKIAEEREQKDPIYNEMVTRFNNAKTVREVEELKPEFVRLGGYRDSKEYLKKCDDKIQSIIEEKKEEHYYSLKKSFENGRTVSEYEELKLSFSKLGDYKDSKELYKACDERILQIKENEKEELYNSAKDSFNNGKTMYEYETIKSSFKKLGDYKDSKELYKACDERILQIKEKEKEQRYIDGIKKIESGKYEKIRQAISIFSGFEDYKDSQEYLRIAKEKLVAIEEKELKRPRRISKIIRTIIVGFVYGIIGIFLGLLLLLSLISEIENPTTTYIPIYIVLVVIIAFCIFKIFICIISFFPRWEKLGSKIPIFSKIGLIKNVFLQTVIRLALQFLITIGFVIFLLILMIVLAMIFN